MKKLEKNNNTLKIQGLLSLIILIIGTLFVKHDAWLYTSPIGLVESVTLVSSSQTTSELGDVEFYYVQSLKVKLLNTADKGKQYTIQNTYSSSHVKEEQYHKGEKIMLSLSDSGLASIVTLKRDTFVAFLLLLFVLILAFIVGKKSIVILLSLAINMGVFLAAVIYHHNTGGPIQYIWLLLVIFTLVTLLLTNGLNRKSIGAICSTLLTVGLVYSLFQLSLLFVEAPSYEMMSFVGRVDDLEGIYMAGMLIGCLGAVCDVAITIHASMSELYQVNPDIPLTQLRKALRQISEDIGSTMINVLLFTYISGSLPILILEIKTGYSLATLLKFSLYFEITRFLLGSIAIIAAIPISALVAISFHKIGRRTK